LRACKHTAKNISFSLFIFGRVGVLAFLSERRGGFKVGDGGTSSPSESRVGAGLHLSTLRNREGGGGATPGCRQLGLRQSLPSLEGLHHPRTRTRITWGSIAELEANQSLSTAANIAQPAYARSRSANKQKETVDGLRNWPACICSESFSPSWRPAPGTSSSRPARRKMMLSRERQCLPPGPGQLIHPGLGGIEGGRASRSADPSSKRGRG
jgi:hypothetical protein